LQYYQPKVGLRFSFKTFILRAAVNDEAIFLGIYAKVAGPGVESSGQASKWHVWGNRDGSFLVQQLLPDEKQNGPIERISDSDFFNNFRVHAALSAKAKAASPKLPAPGAKAPAQNAAVNTKQPSDPARKGQGAFTYYSQKEGGPGKGKPVSPAAEALPEAPLARHAARQPDESVHQKLERRLRSDFSLALIRLGANRDEAIKMLTGMAAHKGPFVETHKFMFSEFGLAMRKRKLFVLAVSFHEKAHALSPGDEHIIFNLARVFYESGKYDKARACLEEVVQIAPGFKHGRDFLDFMDGK